MALELGYNLEEALERQKLSLSDIEDLQSSDIPGAPKTLTKKQVALFLDACGSVENAKKVIEVYYNARRTSPEHFTGRDPRSDIIQQCLDNQDYFHLPATPEGYPIVFHRLSSSKPSNYNFDNAIKTFFMTIDACLHKHGPQPGLIFLFDMKEVRFSHLTRVRISGIKKFFHYLQDGLPGKLCQIHVLNVVSFFDKILSLIKPFMRAEIFKCLHTYPSNSTLEEFYAKYVPKQCLPSDLGGDLASVAELHSQFRKELEALGDYFRAEEIQRNGEQPQKNTKAVPEIRRQFQQLDID